MNDLPLDKTGRPYHPMTEAEKQVHRDRPFDFGPMKRTGEQIAMRERQKAAEAPKVYRSHPEDVRQPEPMGKAIARKVRRSR